MLMIWLMMVLAGLCIWVRRDQAHYACFKQLEASPDRVRYYRRWTLQSFVILTGASAVTLGLLSRLDAVTGLPGEFRPIANLFQQPAAPQQASPDYMIGLAVGLALGLIVTVAVQYRRLRKLFNPTIGDIEPLMTRNGAEARAGLLLSLNAGFSEELFFRLALPLLIAEVTGSAALGLGAAVLAFGAAHAYQGWKGILVTTLAGGVLTVVYLQSGSLLRPMAMHAIIDIVALIIRPAAGRWFATFQHKARAA